MGTTTISWTDKTWNPIRGCSRISEGCRSCYAERMAARFSGPGYPYEGLADMTANGPRWTGKVRIAEEHLDDPLRWRKPCRIFVNSMSDLFHEALPDEAIDSIFSVMSRAMRHTFQVLTKRPERMREFARDYFLGPIEGECGDDPNNPWQPDENIWLGVSVEDRKNKNRINVLRETPAAVRFISFEPLLEDLGELDLADIHWAIIGGESGPGARPCSLSWIDSIVSQCLDAEVPVFVKQLGRNPYDWAMAGDAGVGIKRTKCPKGGDMSEWPQELRIREFPR